MAADLASISALLAFGIPLLILIMLLPALLELKRPRDHGPRRIMDKVSEAPLHMLLVKSIVDIEGEQKLDGATIHPLAKVIAFLPNLEV
ncbi:MAG: hypothetical protein NWE95_07265 [Candidatus Bathyarchaeota archaeon]|nr:hypothetical protein [Candidatus Bathyarchaeota archaeon]